MLLGMCTALFRYVSQLNPHVQKLRGIVLPRMAGAQEHGELSAWGSTQALAWDFR